MRTKSFGAMVLRTSNQPWRRDNIREQREHEERYLWLTQRRDGPINRSLVKRGEDVTTWSEIDRGRSKATNEIVRETVVIVKVLKHDLIVKTSTRAFWYKSTQYEAENYQGCRSIDLDLWKRWTALGCRLVDRPKTSLAKMIWRRGWGVMESMLLGIIIKEGRSERREVWVSRSN